MAVCGCLTGMMPMGKFTTQKASALLQYNRQDAHDARGIELNQIFMCLLSRLPTNWERTELALVSTPAQRAGQSVARVELALLSLPRETAFCES